MYCLGIESTAHTFGAAVADDCGNILSNAVSVFTTASGGMVPNDVAQHHREVADSVIEKALDEAKIELKDIELISFSRGPGLAPCLKIGMEKAKALAKQLGKPIIGVNHCVAHLTIGNLVTGAKEPVYLYVSGVNTQVIALAGARLRIFGETLDIGLGNALDKFGREIGLGFPAGPKIEGLAKKGKLIELPYAVKGMDVSFAGIVTKAAGLVRGKKASPEDVCYSLQEFCFAMLAEVTERAVAHTGKNEVLLIGGVAANRRLCEMLNIMCAARGVSFHAVPLKYAGDQAAMICWQGILEYKAGRKDSVGGVDIAPYERTDAVPVIWQG